MTRAGRRTTPEGDERGAAILDAAVALLVHEGFAAVTHRAVARDADVPLGSVRYYFGSRDELVAAALEQLAERSLQHARAVAADPPADRADAVVALVTGDADRDELLAIYERYVQAARQPRFAARARAWTATLDALCDELLEGTGAPPGRVVVALVDGLLISALLQDGDPREAARDGVRVLLGR